MNDMPSATDLHFVCQGERAKQAGLPLFITDGQYFLREVEDAYV
jgi:hypothetical protein